MKSNREWGASGTNMAYQFRAFNFIQLFMGYVPGAVTFIFMLEKNIYKL